MRRIAILSLASTSMILSGPALGQAAPKLTAEQIVCKMTGDCDSGSDGDGPKIDKPKEAGISFNYPTDASASSAAKPVVAAPARVRGNRRGFVAKPSATPAVGRGLVVSPASSIAIPISFKLGSAALSSEAKAQANVFGAAMTMGKLANRNFVIEGHTDSKGDRARNLDLSRRRAQAVADYLVSQNIDAARIKAVGYGAERPLANHSAASPYNRRVQFSFAD